MRTQELAKQMMDMAAAARDFGQTITINRVLPYVAIDGLPEGEYFLQGEYASDLLDEAEKASNEYDVSVEDYILWMAQGW